jgi:hypothetical protein
MAGKLHKARTKHEAGHAVIARKFGLDVKCVDARSDEPNVTQASAGYAADPNYAAAQIAGYEKDAIIALAGLETNRRDYPDLRVLDGIWMVVGFSRSRYLVPARLVFSFTF